MSPNLLLIMLSALLLVPPLTWAESKVVIAEGTYTMGDGETPLVAESRALHEAKRMAVEQAGTYVESYSKTKNFQLTADEIQTIAGALVEIEVLDKKRTIVGESVHFQVQIKAKVTTTKVEELVARVRNKGVDASVDMVRQYKELQSRYDMLAKDIDELKHRQQEAKSETDKKQVLVGIATNERKYKAIELAERARQSLRDGNNSQAIMYLSEAIQNDPSQPVNYFDRGTIYLDDLAQPERAVSDFTQAITIHEAAYEAALKRPGKSVQEALELWIKSYYVIDFYLRRGRGYIALGLRERAIDDFEAIVKRHPQDPVAYLYRGIGYGELGSYEKAIADYTEALNSGLQGEHKAIAYVSRANAYSRLGQHGKAIADASQGVAMLPNSDIVHAQFGRVLRDAGDIDAAILHFREAVTIEPDSSEHHYDLGHAFTAKGDNKQAVRELRTVLRIKPDHYSAHSILGIALYETNDLEGAVTELRAALALKSDNGHVYYFLGKALNGMGKHEDAERAFRMAIRLKPDFSVPHAELGALLAKRQKYDEAHLEFVEAVRLDPTDPLARLLLGNSLKTHDQTRQAAKEFREAIRLTRSGPDTPRNRGIAELAYQQLRQLNAEP